MHGSRKFCQRGGGGGGGRGVMRGGRIQIPLKAGHYWPASDMPFKWHFAGGMIMAGH